MLFPISFTNTTKCFLQCVIIVTALQDNRMLNQNCRVAQIFTPFNRNFTLNCAREQLRGIFVLSYKSQRMVIAFSAGKPGRAL